jgi:hypothetical protein
MALAFGYRAMMSKPGDWKLIRDRFDVSARMTGGTTTFEAGAVQANNIETSRCETE